MIYLRVTLLFFVKVLGKNGSGMKQSSSIPIKEKNQVKAMIEISDNKKAREDAVSLVRRMNAQRRLKEKHFLDRLTHVKGKITDE